MRRLYIYFCIGLILGCSDSNSNDDTGTYNNRTTTPTIDAFNPYAEWDSTGSSFIQKIHLDPKKMQNIAQVHFKVMPRPNTHAAPIEVTYEQAALESYIPFYSNNYVLPIHGLYENYNNQIGSDFFTFNNNSTRTYQYEILTPAYQDENSIYDSRIDYQKTLPHKINLP